MSDDLGLLVLRVVVGGLLMGHGAQKLFGWFGGFGFAGTRGWMGGPLRLRPAGLWTLMAGLSEFGGGALLAAGLLSPFGSLGIIAAMVMAAVLVHWPRVWVTDGGIEYPLVLVAAALAIGIAGPGGYSLDEAWNITLPAPATLIAGLGAVLLGIIAALGTRAPVPAAAAQPADTTRQAA